MWVKNFVEIALSHTVSEINAFFFCFTQKFKMATQNDGKTIFGKSPVNSTDSLRVQNFVKIALSPFQR